MREIRGFVFDYGLYHRYELSKKLKPGMAIRFDRELDLEFSGMSEIIRAIEKLEKTRKTPKGGKKKESTSKPDIFLRSCGFREGIPRIEVRKPDGSLEKVEAGGYRFAEGDSEGLSIWECVVCSRAQQYETTV